MDARDVPPPAPTRCVGCSRPTQRSRRDGLCPRCAWEAERLIERIELEGLARDLTLITEFDAYYQQRQEHRRRYRELATSPLFPRRAILAAEGHAVVVPFPEVPDHATTWRDRPAS